MRSEKEIREKIENMEIYIKAYMDNESKTVMEACMKCKDKIRLLKWILKEE